MISIIIPCYNAAQYLCEALDSVLNQTYHDWECICTDDGSEDDTGAILDRYALQDERFVVVHQANAGEGAARNAALERSRGDWFLFLDSDDVLRNSALEDVARVIQQEQDVDLIGYGSKQFAEGSAIAWDRHMTEYQIYDCKKALPYCVNTIGVSQFAYRSSKFLKVRFNRLKIGADLVYVSECLAMADSIAKIACFEHGYRVRAQSMSHKERSADMMMDAIDFRRIVFQNLANSGKQLDVAYVRIAGNQWLERVALFIDKPFNDEWMAVWRQWFASLDVARKLPFFNRWQRFVMKVISMTHSIFLARVLCVWLYRLKKLGLHR